MNGTSSTARLRFHLATRILLAISVIAAGAGALALVVPLEATFVATHFEAVRAATAALWGLGWLTFAGLPLLFAAAHGNAFARDPSVVRAVASTLVPGVQVGAIPGFWADAPRRLGLRARGIVEPAIGLVVFTLIAAVSAPTTYLLDDRYTWGAFRLHFGVLALVLGVGGALFAGRVEGLGRRAAELA